MFGIESVNINRSSWHYRWLKKWHLAGKRTRYIPGHYNNRNEYVWGRDVAYDKAPTSICPYFWLLMFTFFVTIAGVMGIYFLLSLLTFLFTVIAALLYFVIRFRTTTTLVYIGSAAGLFLAVYGIARLGSHLIMVLQKDLMHPKEPKKARPKTGFFYVVSNFIKAKKNNVCPMVEFTD